MTEKSRNSSEEKITKLSLIEYLLKEHPMFYSDKHDKNSCSVCTLIRKLGREIWEGSEEQSRYPSPKINDAQIIELFNQGYSLKRISQKLNVSINRIDDTLHKYWIDSNKINR